MANASGILWISDPPFYTHHQSICNPHSSRISHMGNLYLHFGNNNKSCIVKSRKVNEFERERIFSSFKTSKLLEMPKENCKYWDKCYQKNEHHLQKYNHPKKTIETADKGEVTETSPQEKAPKPSEDTPTVSQADDKESAAKDSSRKISEGDRKEIDTSKLREEALGNIAGKNYMEILHKRIRLSAQMEYDELLRSNEFIRHKFLVEMPPEFYAFWKFLKDLRPNDTSSQILDYIEKQFQLLLVGPFEFLSGRFHNATIREPGDYLRHWRFYYDPPEFQTIFVKKDSGVHYGYWRDIPQEKDNLLLARNDSSKGCEFEFVAGNAFDAFLHFLQYDFASTPFTAGNIASIKKSIHKFLETNELQMKKLEELRKQRNMKVVTKTFHRAGIVVPYVSKTQLGYRSLIVTDSELKQIIKLFETAGGKSTKSDGGSPDDSVKTAVMEKLQPIATAASIALDECDFGTSLELGIDLFCSGRTELHVMIQSLLIPAYTLLERPQFIAISKAHMEKRRKDFNLSIFDLDKK